MANKTCIRRKQLDFKLILKGLVGANTLDSASLIEGEIYRHLLGTHEKARGWET